APRPRLVRPTDAERKVRFAGSQHVVEGALQDAPAGEPVVGVAETMNAVLPLELRLGRARLRRTAVVEPEAGGRLRLIMALEQRPRRGNARPFGEALAPPCVILGDRMVLRQIERDQPDVRILVFGLAPIGLGRNPPSVDASQRLRIVSPYLIVVA